MTKALRRATALRVALTITLAAATSMAFAQNAVRGKQLYQNTNGAPLSCAAPGVCHGLDPNLNLNKIKNGSNPAVIQSAITSVDTMKFLSAFLTSATDRADIAAYIANPAAGDGGGGGAALTASASALSFGQTQVGTTNAISNPASITLTNAGAANITITAINKSGTNAADFTANGSCASASPVTLTPGATCTLGATFTPSGGDTRTATLTVASNATTNPAITLSGSGSVSPVATIALSSNSVTFRTQTVATSSPAQSITVTNNGGAALTVTQVSTTPTPEFVATHDCTTVRAQGGTCRITVLFTPAGSGTRSGNIAITTNVGTSNIVLAGFAVMTPTPIASPDKMSVEFPSIRVGTISTKSTFKLENSGNAPMQISDVALGGTDPTQFNMADTSTCRKGDTVAAFASCNIDVIFQPQSAGKKAATLTVAHNASGGTTALNASGTGMTTATSSAVAPSNLGGVGAASPAQLVALGLSLLLVPTVRRRLARRR